MNDVNDKTNIVHVPDERCRNVPVIVNNLQYIWNNLLAYCYLALPAFKSRFFFYPQIETTVRRDEIKPPGCVQFAFEVRSLSLTSHDVSLIIISDTPLYSRRLVVIFSHFFDDGRENERREARDPHGSICIFETCHWEISIISSTLHVCLQLWVPGNNEINCRDGANSPGLRGRSRKGTRHDKLQRRQYNRLIIMAIIITTGKILRRHVPSCYVLPLHEVWLNHLPNVIV